MVKLTKRKGFNFFRSYFDVYNELENNEDKVAFIDALLNRQFLGIKPEELKGMAKFAYISQTNSIDSQVKGFEDKTGIILHPTQGGCVGVVLPPMAQVEEKEKVEVKDKPTVKFSFFNSLLDLGLSKELINDWLAVRKTKKATNTKTAFNNLLIEVEKSGKPINEIINKCVIESWSGFKASWNWQTNNINNQQIKLENNETVRQMSAAVRNHNPSINY
jgi:hypothetical protein